MTASLPLVCTVLGWVDPAALQKLPAYDVMQVKSGLEIVVKRDGQPVAVRLVGIDTPRTGADSAGVDRLKQTNHLRTLVTVGSRVRLVVDGGSSSPLGAHVYREKDDLWINKDMVEQGFATAAARPTGPTRDALLAVETEARHQKRGMWSPDYLAHAAQPSRFEAPVKSRTHPKGSRSRRFAPTPPGGGMPALGMGQMPVDNTGLPFFPMGQPAVANQGMYGWGSNPLGFNSTPLVAFGLGLGPSFVTPNSFTTDANGRTLTESERNRLYQQYLQQQQLQAIQAQQAIQNLTRAVQQSQGAQATGVGAPVNHPVSGPVHPGDPSHGR